VANALVQDRVHRAVIYWLVVTSLIYLLAVDVVLDRPHPVGVAWIQEHYLSHPGGPETSRTTGTERDRVQRRYHTSS